MSQDAIQKNPEKSISSELETVLPQLSTDQIRFVVARHEYSSDKEAAEGIGLKPDTVYHWPPIVKRALALIGRDGVLVAKEVRHRNLAKAMLVKVAGLDSNNESVRQGTSTEIIEWELGKATQVNKNENKGEVVVTIHHVPRRYAAVSGGDQVLAPSEAGTVP